MLTVGDLLFHLARARAAELAGIAIALRAVAAARMFGPERRGAAASTDVVGLCFSEIYYRLFRQLWVTRTPAAVHRRTLIRASDVLLTTAMHTDYVLERETNCCGDVID